MTASETWLHHCDAETNSVHGISSERFTCQKKKIQNTQAWAGEVMATIFFVMQMWCYPHGPP